jgi:DNA processing protein
MTDREALIALNMMQGVGPVTVRELVKGLGSAAAIWTVSARELLAIPGAGSNIVGKILDQRSRTDPTKEIEAARQAGIRIVVDGDPDYPEGLRTLHDPPLALYVRGALQPQDRHSVALVGSRKATHYGRLVAERLGFDLAQAGFCVVSGLARGIDTAAHQGALKAKGRTVAVLGGAQDCLYPPENKPLADQMAEEGAVLSEFPMGREPDRTTFPMRNRIVSGMSLGVVVVEANLTSGAMITANQALEQGKPVFAVPGRIDSDASRGCHALIRSGAQLVESVEDILVEFEQLLPRVAGGSGRGGPGVSPRLSDEERRVLDAFDDSGEADPDELVRQVGLGAAQVSSILLMLEMKRLVRQAPGRRFVRVKPLGGSSGTE